MSSSAVLGMIVLMSSFVIGCAGGAAPSIQPRPILPPPTPTPSSGSISVTIAPGAVGVKQGSTWSFAASVIGSSNQGVVWTIQESSAGGTISNTGVYTAPAVDGVFHVVATAQADTTKDAIATVSVLKSGFTSIGSLSNARLAHTATLLPNGRMLIAGGGSGSDLFDGLYVVEEAELFDPVTGSSSSAGVVSRDFHTATLLLDGNVLLVGGETGYSGGAPIITNTAEVEKATSGLFEPTGSLAAARESHAETLLSDGRVLVTGGVTWA